MGTHSYDVSVNSYKANLDLGLVFGRATMNIHLDLHTGKIVPQGFHDAWNLDTKDWGVRPYSMEAITRIWDFILDGKEFYISYP